MDARFREHDELYVPSTLYLVPRLPLRHHRSHCSFDCWTQVFWEGACAMGEVVLEIGGKLTEFGEDLADQDGIGGEFNVHLAEFC